MAESTVKGSKLKQMPGRQANGTPPAEPAPLENATQENTQTPFDDPASQVAAAPAEAPKKRGRPPISRAGTPAAAHKSILQIIAEVPADYWSAGTARIKIYRLAPLINRNVTSEHRFITECVEPIDEQGIKRECGSGKYRLYLNYKNAAGGGERETARGEVDILDPAYPPKIPAGEWMDDPRNRQWAWAKPKDPALEPAVAPVQTVLDGIRLGNELRKEAREELQQSQPAQAAQPVQPVQAVDPWAAAERILNMRSENPMVTILMARLDAQDRAAEESRKREAALQQELREEMRQRNTAPAAVAAEKPKTLLEQLSEATDAYTKLKSVFGGGAAVTEAAATVTRSRMSGNMEFFKDVLPTIIEPLKPLINAAAHRLTQPSAAQRAANGQPANGQQPPRPVPGSEEDLIQFVERSLMDAVIEYLDTSDGESFAQFVYDGWPQRLKPLQNFTHHQRPGEQGAPVIIELFKHSDVWPTKLAHREQQFKEFVEEFCKWRADGEQAEPETPATASSPSNETESWDSETEVRQEDKG